MMEKRIPKLLKCPHCKNFLPRGKLTFQLTCLACKRNFFIWDEDIEYYEWLSTGKNVVKRDRENFKEELEWMKEKYFRNLVHRFQMRCPRCKQNYSIWEFGSTYFIWDGRNQYLLVHDKLISEYFDWLKEKYKV